MKYLPNTLTGRSVCFTLFVALSLAAFHAPLARLLSLSLKDDKYSQIVVIPLISLGLICLERNRIFLESKYCVAVGVPLLLAGIGLSIAAAKGAWILNSGAGFQLAVFAMIVTWSAGFVLCYGVQSLYAAAFPILFLLLMVPLPAGILDRIIFFLQQGSAQVTYYLFKLAGAPVLRQGLQFSLPGVDIQIVQECSGLRSATALMITSLLAGHLFLRSSWNGLWLCLLTVPIAIFKNAVRIATISWLGVYVDRGFFYGVLHRQGGLPFSLLGLAMLVPVLLALQKAENRGEAKPRIARSVAVPPFRVRTESV